MSHNVFVGYFTFMSTSMIWCSKNCCVNLHLWAFEKYCKSKNIFIGNYHTTKCWKWVMQKSTLSYGIILRFAKNVPYSVTMNYILPISLYINGSSNIATDNCTFGCDWVCNKSYILWARLVALEYIFMPFDSNIYLPSFYQWNISI